jgi:hypothetical protein
MLSHLCRTRLKFILSSNIVLWSFGKWVCTLTASIYIMQYRKKPVCLPTYCMFIAIMDTLCIHVSVTYPFLTNMSTATIPHHHRHSLWPVHSAHYALLYTHTLFCAQQLHLLLSNDQLTKLMLCKLVPSPSCILWETNALHSFSNFLQIILWVDTCVLLSAESVAHHLAIS